MRKRLVLSTLTLLALMAGGIFAVSTEDKERELMSLRIKPAVVMVYSDIKVKVILQTDEGPKEFGPINMNSAGSGFIINPDGYIVTNGHVVKDYHDRENNQLKLKAIVSVLQQVIFPILEKKKGAPLTQAEMVSVFQQLQPHFQCQVQKQLFVFLSNWKYYPAEIKQFSPPITPIVGKTEGIVSYNEEESGKDIAILKIEQTNLPTVNLGDSSTVALQETVFPVGYPGVVLQHDYLSQTSMLECTINSGRVSSLKVDVKGTPVIQFDASVTWGNSGGPVFNSKGDVVGIATFISLAQSGQGSIPIQGFSFAVPINTAKEFINAAGFQPKSSIFDTMWRDALDLYNDEDYEETVRKCDELLRILPDQPDAKNLQRKAQLALAQNPPGPMKMVKKYWWALAIVVGLGFVILLFVMVLLFRGKKGVAPPAPMAAAPQPTTPEMKMTVMDVGAGKRQLGSYGRLVCEKGPNAGTTWEVPAEGLSIGRDPAQCTLVVADDHVSKVHAVLKPSPSGLVLEDRNSTNGTFVNQVGPKGITRVIIKAGDRIIMGSKQAAIFRVE